MSYRITLTGNKSHFNSLTLVSQRNKSCCVGWKEKGLWPQTFMHSICIQIKQIILLKVNRLDIPNQIPSIHAGFGKNTIFTIVVLALNLLMKKFKLKKKSLRFYIFPNLSLIKKF